MKISSVSILLCPTIALLLLICDESESESDSDAQFQLQESIQLTTTTITPITIVNEQNMTTLQEISNSSNYTSTTPLFLDASSETVVSSTLSPAPADSSLIMPRSFSNTNAMFRSFNAKEATDYAPSHEHEHEHEHEEVGVEEVAIVAKEAGLIFAGAASKLFLKFATVFLAKFPFLATALLPGITSFYFLAGVLFGRLTAGIINPTLPTTVTTTAAPTTTRGTANLFFGTNLTGAGTQLSADVGTCVDFPDGVSNQISSLQLVTGTCVLLCDPTGCTGSCYRITGTTTINDLGSFNMLVSSLMFC